LIYARIANIEVNDKELQIAIKGDAKEEYPAIRKVMDILQDQKINSFSLVTGLRGKDFIKKKYTTMAELNTDSGGEKVVK
jgi:hypothetical protein